jgi:hypothetical protein
MSWALGGTGAGFFFFLFEVPPAELRLESEDTDPNLSLLLVCNDLRGTGQGSGVTPLHHKIFHAFIIKHLQISLKKIFIILNVKARYSFNVLMVDRQVPTCVVPH